MKNTLQGLCTLCIAGVVIAAGCKTTKNNTAPTIPSNQLFAALKTTPQSISVNAGRDTVVYATGGTMLHFYTKSFKDASGNIITSGAVNIQIVEMYKPGDMVCNHATTMSSDQMLLSGGQISISATMNGKPVYANTYGLGFVHNGPSGSMALFYGTTNNADSLATWTQSDTTGRGTKVNATVVDTSKYRPAATQNPLYVFDSCTNFSMVNCDWFDQSDSPKTTVSVILPDPSFDGTNTQLYLLLPKLVRPWRPDTTTGVLSGSERYIYATKTMELYSGKAIVPAGMNYELVVIANKNGTYYYYETSGVVPHNGIAVIAEMATETSYDIVARLKGL